MTDMPSRLATIAVAPDGDDYRLSLTLADGSTIETLVTFEQLDTLGEDIDRQLDADDEWPESPQAG
jgi:hypothetical protein